MRRRTSKVGVDHTQPGGSSMLSSLRSSLPAMSEYAGGSVGRRCLPAFAPFHNRSEPGLSKVKGQSGWTSSAGRRTEAHERLVALVLKDLDDDVVLVAVDVDRRQGRVDVPVAAPLPAVRQLDVLLADLVLAAAVRERRRVCRKELVGPFLLVRAQR